jgi:hypothetical protein
MSGVDLLVGIDDTNGPDTPGTGRTARSLADALAVAGLGEPAGVTRHQLLVDDRIPATGRNTGACIAWRRSAHGNPAAVAELAAAFLAERSAATADPGLAVVELPVVGGSAELVAFGRAAQTSLVHRDDAVALATRLGVGLFGGAGVVGALASAALASSGHDGLFIAMPGIRELAGTCTYGELLTRVPFDVAGGPGGAEPSPDDLIALGDWVRPVLRGGRAVLLLDAPVDGVWAVASREAVKTAPID